MKPLRDGVISGRFWSQVDKTKPCWTWKGPPHSSPKPPRRAYLFTFGQVPKGFCVGHGCGNLACINPQHLILTTRSNLSRQYGNNSHLSVAERFWSNVMIKGEDCWLWSGPGMDARGRALFITQRHPKKVAYVNRYAYQFIHGSIPEGMNVLHACDNPRCVNPSHLRAGTQKDNVRDCVLKGRKGKLSWAKVAEIRRQYADNDVSISKLARAFHTTPSNVSCIVHYRTWTQYDEALTEIKGLIATDLEAPEA